MAIQLILIWTLVIAVTVWFVRDEKKRTARSLEARAAYFATAQAYRYERPQPPANHTSPEALPPRKGGLSESQRRYFNALMRRDQ